jgi:hypothetical protein
MSLGFILFVTVLHIIGKVREERLVFAADEQACQRASPGLRSEIFRGACMLTRSTGPPPSPKHTTLRRTPAPATAARLGARRPATPSSSDTGGGGGG